MKHFIETNVETVEMSPGQIGHHGDVVVICVNKLPDDFEAWTPITDGCLAYGEATGHAHKLFGDVEIRENPKTKERAFIQKDNVVYLKHQEHHPRALVGDGKFYITRIKKEYDHFDKIMREVAD